jgi:hypothetical protein
VTPDFLKGKKKKYIFKTHIVTKDGNDSFCFDGVPNFVTMLTVSSANGSASECALPKKRHRAAITSRKQFAASAAPPTALVPRRPAQRGCTTQFHANRLAE